MKCPFCMKICSKCKRLLVANSMNFVKKKHGKYGLNTNCKKCRNEYRKNNKNQLKKQKKIYYESNKEYFKEKHKEYYENNKEEIKKRNKQYYDDNKEEIKKQNKQYRDKHKDEIKEYNKQYNKKHEEDIKEYMKKYREKYEKEKKEYDKRYREENKDKIKNYMEQYYKENPDKFFNYNNKRRSKEENQGNGITKEQWLEMMEFFEFKCAYSGKSLNKDNRSIDHIIPLFNEGEHEIWNCIPMLKNLNSSKGINDMLDWYQQQDFYSEERLNKIYKWIEYAYKRWS